MKDCGGGGWLCFPCLGAPSPFGGDRADGSLLFPTLPPTRVQHFLLLGPEEKEEKMSSALVSPTPLPPC